MSVSPEDLFPGTGHGVVLFTASWDGACLGYSDLIAEVAADLEVPLLHLDVDDDRASSLAEELGVRYQVPALVFARDSQFGSAVVGCLTLDQAREAIGGGQ